MALENYTPDWLLENFAILLFILAVIVASFTMAKIVGRALNTYYKVASKKLDVNATTYCLVKRIIVAFVYFAGGNCNNIKCTNT